MKIIKTILFMVVIACLSCNQKTQEEKIKELVKQEVSKQSPSQPIGQDFIVDYETQDTIAIKLPFDPQRVVADSLFWHNKTDSIQARHMKLFWRANDLYLQDLLEYQNFLRYRDAKKKKQTADSTYQNRINLDSNSNTIGSGLGCLEVLQAEAYNATEAAKLSKR